MVTEPGSPRHALNATKCVEQMSTLAPTEFQCTIVTSFFDIAIQGILGVGCFASLLVKRYWYVMHCVP